MFFKLLKDALKVKNVRNKIFLYTFYHLGFPHWNTYYRARYQCEKS